jgi:hypothetical protein
MKRLLFLLLLVGASFSRVSQAYPSFIGYGYTSCIVCHFNAFGNGPLTDYGRALGATAIASKPFYNPNISDEAYGAQSGFLGDPNNLGQHVRAQFGYRGLFLARSQTKRWITMQSDGSLIYKSNEDRIVALVTVGYAAPPGGASTSTEPKFISREHYISFFNGATRRVYVGMTDVVFGIRSPDHTSAPRTLVKINKNDQVHGVSGHWGKTNRELGAHLFVGNLFQDASARPYGVSGMGEWDIAEKVRLGGSILGSMSSVRTRAAAALHLRAGFGKDTNKLLASYAYLQSATRLSRGLQLLFTAEFKTTDTFRPRPRVMTYGPSIQWFPFNRLELRSDLLASRSIGGVTESFLPADSYTWLAQVHLWF